MWFSSAWIGGTVANKQTCGTCSQDYIFVSLYNQELQYIIYS